MKILGITGGSNAGKSSLLKAILEKSSQKVVYFDADQALHDMYATDAEVITAIGELCPDAVANGKVDRGKLAQYYFTSDENAKAVEAITVEKIRAQFHMLVATHCKEPDTLLLLDMPLLTEIGLHKYCDKVILVTCDPAERVERGIARITGSKQIERAAAEDLYTNIVRRQTGLPAAERATLSAEESIRIADDIKRRKLKEGSCDYTEIDTSNRSRSREETERATAIQALETLNVLWTQNSPPHHQCR